MWRRARYYIDHFLNTSASVSDPVKRTTTAIGRLSKKKTRELLQDRMRQAVSTKPNGKSALISLPYLQTQDATSQRIGFVGVALDENIATDFTNDITLTEGLNKEQSESEKTEKREVLEKLEQLLDND
jgi:hypothetical protein